MVQVDVFWSWGIGAGLGAASAWRAKKSEPLKDAARSTELSATLLFLACCFAPSGFVLLWNFPSWETMLVGTRDMPGWLVAAFGVTNITQGAAGFLAARWLTTHGKGYGGYLNLLAGYFGMFFILVHGWDGSGYRRFFSARPEQLNGWTWSTAAQWLTSDVALTLAVMGIFLVPWLVGLSVRWLHGGHLAARVAHPPSRVALGASLLALLVLAMPALAIAASVAIRQLGWIGGTLAFAVAAYALCLRKGGLLHKHYGWMHLGQPFFSAPAPRLVPAS
jgi:hypothetical protein